MGEYSTTVDDKGRITVPRAIRVSMEANAHYLWYITRGFDGCLFLFNQEEWNKIRTQMGKHASMHTKAMDLRRLLFGSVAEVKPDGQGRMGVPPHLREFAGIDKDAVLLGVDDHLELWSKDAWRAFQIKQDAAYKEMAMQLFTGEGASIAADVEVS